MRKMVHHLKRTKARQTHRQYQSYTSSGSNSKSPKIKRMEIKLTAGETQDPVHTATDPPNKQRRLQKTGTAPIQPNTQATAAPKRQPCACAQKEKNCRNSIQNTKMVIQKPSRLNYFINPQNSSLKRTQSGGIMISKYSFIGWTARVLDTRGREKGS